MPYQESKSNVIVFYEVDRDLMDNNRAIFTLPEREYINWFKSSSRYHSFSKSFVNEVLIHTQRINNMLTIHLLEDKIWEDSCAQTHIYCYLQKLSANLFINEMNKSSYSEQVQSEVDLFKKMLTLIVEGKVSVIVEYSKDEGWFDYDGILKSKRELEEKNRPKQ
ncbi:hypothetical protein GA0116948_107201 [Chitinophaga costaii]|uniref:Uncharacterized protein n=1 Tax=Chitinophaga costaii TaxID=1335309 RepID=A0A1C4EA91_9BACT|nr:hypothetical protein [Chitinophaga costaii]SCC40460.1 hypothetical protein GA0116948_107201 [Chitinophaga costaii]